MFGLGMPEILMILAIALIVIGPKKLPELAKTLGRAMGEFKRSAQDFKRSIDVENTVKEFEDLDTPQTDLKQAVKEAAAESKREDTPEGEGRSKDPNSPVSDDTGSSASGETGQDPSQTPDTSDDKAS